MKDIDTIIYSIELRDPYTKGHSRRVALYARGFLKYINASNDDIEKVYTAGMLHDIGKIAIPDSVLLKPCLLNHKEYEIIKHHPVLSESLIKKMPEFSSVAKIVRHHHENYDGSGYPDRLKEDEIPFLSRVLSLADVFDALSTERIYRSAFSMDESIDVMKDMKYKFDQGLFSEFVKFIKEKGVLKENAFHLEETEEVKIQKIREEVFFEDVFTGLLNRNALLLLIRKFIEKKHSISVVKLEFTNLKTLLSLKGVSFIDKTLKLCAAEIKNILNVSLHVNEPEEGGVYAFRISGGVFLFLTFGNSVELLKSLQKVVEKIEIYDDEVGFEYECIFEDKIPDYRFEKLLDYLR